MMPIPWRRSSSSRVPGQALIRRAKTRCGRAGKSRVLTAYLSRESVRWLKVWLKHAEVSEGAIFRRRIGRGRVGEPLNPGNVTPIFKRVAR